MRAAAEVIEQAKAWQQRRIVSSDYRRLREDLFGERPLDDDDDDHEDFGWGGDVLPAPVAIGLIRQAANHYPHPCGGVLLDAALKKLVPQIGFWSTNGVTESGVEYEAVDDIIRKILEEPDALLG